MKKMLIPILVLIMTLTGCKSSYVFTDEIVTSDHYIVRMGQETHFETGRLMEDIIKVVHNGVVHYEIYENIYLPNEDGTAIVIVPNEQPITGYLMDLYNLYPDVDVEQLHQEVMNHDFNKMLIGIGYSYRDDDKYVRLEDIKIDSLTYFVNYFDDEWIYQYEVIAEDEFVLPEYVMYSDEVTDVLFNNLDYMIKSDIDTYEGTYGEISIRLELDNLLAFITTPEYTFIFDTVYFDACILNDDDSINCDPIYITEDGSTISVPIRFYIEDYVPDDLLRDLNEFGILYYQLAHTQSIFRK